MALGFLVFWLLNMYVVVRGSNAIKALEAWAAPFLIVSGLALLAWAVGRAGGFGPVLSQPSRFTHDRRVPGRVRALAHRDGRLLGHARAEHPGPVALRARPAGAGVGPVPRPADDDDAVLVHRRGGDLGVGRHLRRADVGSRCSCSRGSRTRWWSSLALFALLIATLTTNVAANVVAPANGFANLWPARINFARGGILTGIIGIAIMPWRLLENADRYMGWLVAYSGFLGPIAGIFIADYWVVRRGAAVAAGPLRQPRHLRPLEPARASSRSRRASRWRWSGWSCRRCGRCTITRGSWGSRARSCVYVMSMRWAGRLRAGRASADAAPSAVARPSCDDRTEGTHR